MQWFVGRELYIAYTLSRRFYWQANILWPEDLQCPTTVVLSSEDHIVPSHSVRMHLTSWEARRRRQAGDGSAKILSVVWLERVGHAGFLLHNDARERIVDLIVNDGEEGE